MSRAISLPFSFDSNGGVAYTTDDRKIWQDRVVLAVMTYFGERVMRPNYGSSVEESTFENTTTAISMINQAIAGAFSFWLPDLSLGKVEKVLDDDNGILSVNINYSYGPGQLEDSVTIRTDILSRSGDLIREVRNGQQ